jgi:thioredoxin-dependent peroxiredoxin
MADALEGQDVPSVMLLPYSGGGKINLPKDILGSWTVLYFYPKDDTPGCTVEACSYRDSMAEFQKKGVKVFGVSSDQMPSHHAFIAKYQLNFPLIADLHNILIGEMGSYIEKEKDGKKYMGISRDTFVINPEGKIVKVWRKVDPEKTVAEVKQYLESALK